MHLQIHVELIKKGVSHAFNKSNICPVIHEFLDFFSFTFAFVSKQAYQSFDLKKNRCVYIKHKCPFNMICIQNA